MSKVMMAFPPIKDAKGFPTASQNRQFQYFKDPTFIYPIIPATFVSMLLDVKEEVCWVDAIAEQMNEVDFGKIILQMHPDYMVFESNTPLINKYYEVISAIKESLPDVKIILCGEHATAFPEEVKKNCKADYIIEGGKWYYEAYKIITGNDWGDRGLPFIDRNATRWWLYAYKNGNFKYIPATYIMSAQDCWYGKCKFCSWASYHKDYAVRQVDDVLAEIEHLINMGFKEIFDDSGTLPTGAWIKEFCEKMIERGYNDYISISCNLRFGSLWKSDYELMAKAGFRMVLWGLESANQKTLDMLEKGYCIDVIKPALMCAKKAGLKSHLTCMFGYPWESLDEAKNTYKFVRKLLLDDLAFSAQATICIPYPKTPLWEYCKEKELLITEDWDRYDMSEPIMKIPYSSKELFKMQKGIYNIAYHPKFLWNKLMGCKDWEDVKYYFRIGRKIYDRFGNYYQIEKVRAD